MKSSVLFAVEDIINIDLLRYAVENTADARLIRLFTSHKCQSIVKSTLYTH
jgi:hypothetical protein